MQHHFFKAAALVAWAAVASCQEFAVVARGNVGAIDYVELQKNLSGESEFYFPGSGEFEDATARWSNFSVPIASIVVVPATEQDVVNTVSTFIECSVLGTYC